MNNKTLLSIVIAAFSLLPLVAADVVTGPEMLIMGGLAITIFFGIPAAIIAVIAWLIIRHMKKKNAKNDS